MDADTECWLTSPENGYEAIELPHTVGTKTFLGDQSGDRMRVYYFQNRSDGSLAGKVWFGAGAQGPPGHAHGGSIAALLDEAMGGAAWVAGRPVVAAEITTRFKKMVPLQGAYSVTAWLERTRGRKVEARAELRGRDASLFAEGEGLFVELDIERLTQLARGSADLRPFLKIRQRG